MTIERIWFIIDAIFWIGFFVLEGFDFGVGMLQSSMARDETERRVLINSIGPIWDGNEVWLIVAGAVIFAAFPAWYATMFSSFYLALLVVLVALMARGLAFEYRRKIDSPRWRALWTWGMAAGSALVPFLLGVALGDLLHGLPIDKAGNYTGSFFDLLVPYGLWCGLTLLSLSLLMGISFLALKTTGHLRERARQWSRPIAGAAVVTVFGLLTWTHVGLGKGFFPNPLEVLAMLAVIAAAMVTGSEETEGWTFVAAALGTGATVGSIFVELFPDVMVSSTNHAYSLTIAGTASPTYTLTVMTVVAVIFFPVVLVYQGWSLHVFRKRLASPATAAGDEPVEAHGAGSGAGLP
jgi:cytochrome d ubiquinol oxidase subunit II